ncbi:mucin-2-like [Anopheles bellator]|uniref:mucin-2-like n=1 Tax=Anopheles bellator TaxID=139047 RepID=UPI00264992B0|nr:mucin-2-like [Anopheles bellator]
MLGFRLLGILLLAQASLGGAQLFGRGQNAVAPAGRNVLRQGDRQPQHDHTHIETIDVKCDQRSGMLVTVQFEDDFQGVIYSQGYHNDPKCRYVQANQGGRQFTFTVPYAGCGSKPSCAVCASVDNVLVIQTDDEVQEAWDTARRISCSQSEQQQNTIIFKPFVVDQLEVINVPTSTGGVDCWMDIQRGTFPRIEPIPSIIKIGEALSVLVYLRDPKGEYDVSVKDCYAYDSADYDAPSTARLQLSDKNGCSRKKKLFGLWQKTTQTGDSGATLVVHNSIKAFKFPDRMQVFLKCDIEICRGGCGPQVCAEENLISTVATYLPPVDKPNCYPGSTDPRCPQTTPRPVPTTTPAPRCFPGSTDPRCPQTTPRPVPTTTPAPRCFPGSTDPRCPQTTTRPVPTTTSQPRCYPGSNDPRCPQTTAAPRCYPGSDDPRCPRPTTARPVPTTTAAARCFPGSTDPRCPQTTPRPTLKCYPGSTDPRCPQTTSRPLPTTPPAPRCYPGSSDPRCPTTPRPTTQPPLRCFPGSTDPRCPQTTPRPVPSTTPPTTQPPLRCFPGSTDPRCPQTTPRPVPTTAPAPRCFPGSTDLRCPTTARPTTTTRKPCYPGSPDPACPRPFVTTTPSPCYPGSPDPNCPQPYRPTSTNPPATYLPPFPATANARPARHLSPETLNDINALADLTDQAAVIAETSSSASAADSVNANESRPKRDASLANELDGEVTKEIISITLNIKGYQFAADP